MSLTPFTIYFLMSGFCFRCHAIENQLNQTQEVGLGSDVSLRCEVSLLSESSTLQWEKDEGQTSNTTLIYNNTAYIILHTVNEHSKGKYYCKLRKDGGEQTIRIHTLNVKTNSYTEKYHTIYRQCSNNSDVSLICKSSKTYESWKWTWEPRPNSQIDLMAVEKGGQVQAKGSIKPGNCSSTKYNSQAFNFHISPVNFSYRGKYRCITETTTYTTITLHTIRVSVEPPVGEWRNQSVVLTCEVSEVTDPVTLVWLRMEGNRGVLEKQQIMNEKNKKLQLTVNLSSYETQSLQWKCAVFTEDKLRALGPVNSAIINCPTENSAGSPENDVNSHTKAAISSVLALLTGILLGALLYYCYRKRMPVDSNSQESEPVYINISQMRNDRAERRGTLGIRGKIPETYCYTRRNSHDKTNINKRDETPDTDSVTYATIYFNKSRGRN